MYKKKCLHSNIYYMQCVFNFDLLDVKPTLILIYNHIKASRGNVRFYVFSSRTAPF